MTIDKIVRCLNQVFRPEIHVPLDGVGNCLKCEYDDKNKECKGYQPIAIYSYEVKYDGKTI